MAGRGDWSTRSVGPANSHSAVSRSRPRRRVVHFLFVLATSRRCAFAAVAAIVLLLLLPKEGMEGGRWMAGRTIAFGYRKKGRGKRRKSDGRKAAQNFVIIKM